MSYNRTALTILSLLIACTLLANGGDKAFKLPKHVKENFVLIPGGETMIDGEKLVVDEFYMYRQEITNLDYREFLFYLGEHGSEEQLSIAKHDTAAWHLDDSDFSPFAQTYHEHPAYEEYPVVTISHEAAVLYCQWLTERLNEDPTNPYTVEARLPTQAEWIRATRPNDPMAVYAWGGPYLRNAKGQYLCNFYNTGAESITRDPDTGELTVVRNGSNAALRAAHVGPAPALSFEPGLSGAYNLNGNVAEMLTEPGIAMGGSWRSPGYDVRNESAMPIDRPSPEVGFRPVLIFKAKE